MSRNFNSHASSEEKCVEIVKTLHVKFFPFGSVEPVGCVTVKPESEILYYFEIELKSGKILTEHALT